LCREAVGLRQESAGSLGVRLSQPGRRTPAVADRTAAGRRRRRPCNCRVAVTPGAADGPDCRPRTGDTDRDGDGAGCCAQLPVVPRQLPGGVGQAAAGGLVPGRGEGGPAPQGRGLAALDRVRLALVSRILIGTVVPAFHLLFAAGDSSGVIAYCTTYGAPAVAVLPPSSAAVQVTHAAPGAALDPLPQFAVATSTRRTRSNRAA
jgi:hypothetical protein